MQAQKTTVLVDTVLINDTVFFDTVIDTVFK